MGRVPSAVGYQPTLQTEMGALQERITSTKTGSITSVQAVYVPADDLTDLLRQRHSPIWMQRRYFHVPSLSWVFIRPLIRWNPHHVCWIRILLVKNITVLPEAYRRFFSVIKNYRILSLFLVWMNFQKKISWLYPEHVRFRDSCPSPFFVGEQFTGLKGRYVPLSETIQGFKEIIAGKYDDIPESYFLMAGNIDDVLAKVK